jgi:hypothetical protein
MEQDLPYNHQLENYLLGKLSEAEHHQFEQQLAHDSQLREELDMQHDIMEGLKESRRLELKARLDNVPVNSGWVYSPLAKIAAGIVIVGTAGLAIFFNYEGSNSDESKLVSEIAISSETNFTEIPAIPEPVFTPLAENTSSTLVQPVAEAVVTEPKKATKASTKSLANKGVSQPKGEAVEKDYTVSSPNLVSDFEDQDFVAAPIGDKPKNKVFESTGKFITQPLDVATKADEKYNFHYQFTDGKLYIFGEFSQAPYEVLEINKNGKSQYFLYFSGNFYSLKNNQRKPTPLEQITNKNLIKELTITRSSK